MRGCYDALLSEQVSRLVLSAQLRSSQIHALYKALGEARLMPAMVSEDLAEELARICGSRYDEPKKESSRLRGFGWTHLHLATHMDRALRGKLAALATVLRTRDASALSSSLAVVGADDRGGDDAVRCFADAADMVLECDAAEAAAHAAALSAAAMAAETAGAAAAAALASGSDP